MKPCRVRLITSLYTFESLDLSNAPAIDPIHELASQTFVLPNLSIFMDKWEQETKPFRDKIKNAIHIIDQNIERLQENKHEWTSKKSSPDNAKMGTELFDKMIERFQEIKYALT